MTDSGWRLSGELEPELAEKMEAELEHLCDQLGAFPPTFSRFEQPNSTLWRVDIYFPEEPDETFVESLLDRIDLNRWNYEFSPIEDRDWVSESQKLLSPVKAGRFFVFGSHDADQVNPSLINLQIDAGQAFGTGKHETTAACLGLLDSIADTITPRSYLDLGTGSGVLALAAAKLWPGTPGTATDIDPVAVAVAEENCRVNAVPVRKFATAEPGIALKTADGLNDRDIELEQPYDLIFANILAGPLVEMAPDISNALAPGGTLILSGLLIEQQDEVLAAYHACGFKLTGYAESGDWAALQIGY